MTASDYPVTFAYGATDGYFYGPNGIIGPYHRGDDRVMPIGTPVVVNGVEIGKSGNTGNVSGPHLHVGKFVGGVDQNPQSKGFQLSTPATVYNTGSDTTNGNYVQITDNGGTLWVYLHLSQIEVTKGQVIQMDKITKEQEQLCSLMQTGSYPGKDYNYRFTGLPLTQLNLDAMLQFWQSQARPPQPNTPILLKPNTAYITP